MDCSAPNAMVPTQNKTECTGIDLALDRHETTCPHCRLSTAHFWPGDTILFASVRCTHCREKFLIVQNELWPE